MADRPPGDPWTWPADSWLAGRGRARLAEGNCPGCGNPLAPGLICAYDGTRHGGAGSPQYTALYGRRGIRWETAPGGAITFQSEWPIPPRAEETPKP